MRQPPPWLVPSASVDLALLFAGRKPAVRLLAEGKGLQVRRWARRHGLFTGSDGSGYVVVARSGIAARRAIDLDGRPGRHTLSLGRMLGYPVCCSRAAARVGDEGIDRLAAGMGSRRFRGRFRAIDPSGYALGQSVIAHVPCSPCCRASLALVVRPPRC